MHVQYEKNSGQMRDILIQKTQGPGGQEFHFPHFFLKFRSSFPETFLIFFLILALREGPGYATEKKMRQINTTAIQSRFLTCSASTSLFDAHTPTHTQKLALMISP